MSEDISRYTCSSEYIVEIDDSFFGRPIDELMGLAVIGIDQSFNSTGLTVAKVWQNKLHVKLFCIVNGRENCNGDWDGIDFLHYIGKDTNTKQEFYIKENNKLLNAEAIVNYIDNVVMDLRQSGWLNETKLIVGALEGISYNANGFKRRTSSNIYDLSALNMLIRKNLRKLCVRTTNFSQFLDIASVIRMFPPKQVKSLAANNGSANKFDMYKQTCQDLQIEQIYNESTFDKHAKHWSDVSDSYCIAKSVFKTINIK